MKLIPTNSTQQQSAVLALNPRKAGTSRRSKKKSISLSSRSESSAIGRLHEGSQAARSGSVRPRTRQEKPADGRIKRYLENENFTMDWLDYHEIDYLL